MVSYSLPLRITTVDRPRNRRSGRFAGGGLMVRGRTSADGRALLVHGRLSGRVRHSCPAPNHRGMGGGSRTRPPHIDVGETDNQDHGSRGRRPSPGHLRAGTGGRGPGERFPSCGNGTSVALSHPADGPKLQGFERSRQPSYCGDHTTHTTLFSGRGREWDLHERTAQLTARCRPRRCAVRCSRSGSVQYVGAA